MPFKEGKVAIAERIAAENSVDLSAAVYFGDGSSDVPLLERVGHPVCVHARKKLLAVAAERGWPVHT